MIARGDGGGSNNGDRQLQGKYDEKCTESYVFIRSQNESERI